MRKIKVVVLLVQQLQHGFTKNAKVSPNLTVAHIYRSALCLFISSVSLVLCSTELTQITYGISQMYTIQTNH